MVQAQSTPSSWLTFHLHFHRVVICLMLCTIVCVLYFFLHCIAFDVTCVDDDFFYILFDQMFLMFTTKNVPCLGRFAVSYQAPILPPPMTAKQSYSVVSQNTSN